MRIQLRNKKKVLLRLLEQNDTENLFVYFASLSATTRSRYGPHPFDRATVISICNNLSEEIEEMRRYIAIDEAGAIVAYMLIKRKMIEEDRSRLLAKNIYFDQESICTFAPSVADDWQNSGLGSSMYDFIEKDIIDSTPWRTIILWGGVQAANERAVHFYEKKGFQHLGIFRNNDMDNFDMMKRL